MTDLGEEWVRLRIYTRFLEETLDKIKRDGKELLEHGVDSSERVRFFLTSLQQYPKFARQGVFTKENLHIP